MVRLIFSRWGVMGWCFLLCVFFSVVAGFGWALSIFDAIVGSGYRLSAIVSSSRPPHRQNACQDSRQPPHCTLQVQHQPPIHNTVLPTHLRPAIAVLLRSSRSHHSSLDCSCFRPRAFHNCHRVGAASSRHDLGRVVNAQAIRRR
jgi:hypothetical protein